MNINSIINDIFLDIVTIRRQLHQYPELSEHESDTAELICNELKKLNIPYISDVAGHGVVAMMHGTKNSASANTSYSTVAIRADIDAISLQEKCPVSFASKNTGIMHACGHDLHTAILLGSARVLKRLENTFSGTVKLFFQPSEETIGGALQMIDTGCMDNPKVDAVIGLHIHPQLPTGTVEFFRGDMNAASTELELIVNGTTCHGAHPDEGIDPILIGSHIMVALQSVCSRKLDPTTPGVVTIGKFNAGSAHNVIPNIATMNGIIRAMNLETRNQIKEQVEIIAKNTAMAYGGTCTVNFKDSYPALINNLELGTTLESVASRVLGNENIIIAPKPSLGTDDFSYFSQMVPSVYFNIGTKKPGDLTPYGLHSEFLNPDEDAIKTGILMEVSSVLEMLQ